MSHTSKTKGAIRVMPEEDPEFQIAPMIDILLVLLVFFMSISSTQVLQSNEQVQLPVAAKASDPKEGGNAILNILWIPLGNVGQISYNDQTVSDPAAVIPSLQQQLKINPKLRVIIRADRRAPYSFIRPLLVAIGQAGAINITFSVINKEEEK